jgi:hypothetical protein
VSKQFLAPDDRKPLHIGIAIPCQDHVDWAFARDLSAAVGFHAFTFPEDDISQNWYQSAFLAESRNKMCKDLVEQGCDYVIFLDTDMEFPQDTFARLLQHDVDVVAANCSKRRRPISATARKENPDDPEKLDAVWPDKDKQGLERIAVVGTAVMCIKSEVLMSLPYPWFNTPWNHEKDQFVGEDLYFCGLLKRHGFGLYIDHGLSWDVKHIGTYAYGMNDVLAEREAARAGLWNHIAPEFNEPAKLVVV